MVFVWEFWGENLVQCTGSPLHLIAILAILWDAVLIHVLCGENKGLLCQSVYSVIRILDFIFHPDTFIWCVSVAWVCIFQVLKACTEHSCACRVVVLFQAKRYIGAGLCVGVSTHSQDLAGKGAENSAGEVNWPNSAMADQASKQTKK